MRTRTVVTALACVALLGCDVGAISTSTGGNPSGGNPSGGNPSGGNPSGNGPGGNPSGNASPIAATHEICNDGLDNDLDGDVDENCPCDERKTPSQACYPGPAATRNVGQCKDGRQLCARTSGEFGAFGACSGAVLPATEICGDGIDNDCNGKVDDAPGCACKPGEQRACYSGPPATKDVGACKAGLEVCKPDGSGWGACQGEVLPGQEKCGDSKDNDCNGKTDDGCTAVHVPQQCTVQTLTHAVGAVDCAPNQAVYMMDDGGGPNFICCPLPANDVLSSAPAVVRFGGCAKDEVITGATAQFTFKCTAINTKRYTLGALQKPCYFGSGASGSQGVGRCQNHPASFSVLQQNLFGSDGCSGMPYGALFVTQLSKYCRDMGAATLTYAGNAGDPPPGTPVTMFK